MERIKQALEKARQERGEAPPPAPGSDSGTARRTAALAEPESITYTETRTFQPSPEVLRRNRILGSSADDPTTVAAYRMLRTQVLQRMKERSWKALAVTSPGPDEGKTLTAVNLAISLAREVNHTVLLVDLDLRNPSVHRCFGDEPQKGISDIVLHGAAVAEVLVNPGFERLVVLPGREVILNSSEVLSSPGLVSLVHDLKHRYPSRLVIFDLPPLLSADDALAFAPYVDAALLVLEEGKTTRDDVTRAVGYLRNTELLGTVLNKSQDPVGGYY
jgi:capsular exopolysaccharide synthesis family protein